MKAEIKCYITEENNGKSVERILKKEFDVSASMITFMKNNARLHINGKPCRSIDICKTGDLLTADVSENTERPDNIDLWEFEPEILFDDQFITVVNKPGGMEVHPCLSNRSTTLANAVMYYWSQKGEYHNYHIVNRLDKNTSGICVIAKNRFAHGALALQMKNNTFYRGYKAVIHGVPDPLKGSVELPINRTEDSIIKRTVDMNGKYAKTNYSTVNVFHNRFSLLDIELETGRTHQIRVHFSHLGYPLVGDWLYGSGDIEKNLIGRHALHAYNVKFFHPVYKNELIFNTDFPDDMKKLLTLCEKEMEIG